MNDDTVAKAAEEVGNQTESTNVPIPKWTMAKAI